MTHRLLRNKKRLGASILKKKNANIYEQVHLTAPEHTMWKMIVQIHSQ